jgi:hypothetical protein
MVALAESTFLKVTSLPSGEMLFSKTVSSSAPMSQSLFESRKADESPLLTNFTGFRL